MKNQPIHQLKGLTNLNRSDLDKKLTQSFSRSFEKLFEVSNIVVFFDLSQCRFCELGAIAKLILIIDNHISIGDGVYIALPTFKRTDKEKRSEDFSKADKVAGLLQKRKDANRFLHTCGFVSTIQESSKFHRNEKVYFTEEYNFESEKFNEKSFKESFSVIYEDASIENYEYKYLLPFQWLDCSEQLNSFKEIGDKFEKILTNPERGIEAIDVKAIKNVVISELIKNVTEHSEKSYALVAIGLIDTKAYQNKNSDHDDVEIDYLKWVGESGFESQVEICFGDSGVGILTEEFRKKYPNPGNPSTNPSKEQLRVAFQKWTSTKDNSPRRGTKGLYRIQRIVNKYNGIIHIDTSKHWGGFQKGGKAEAKYKYKASNYNFQGTLINIKLNPYKQIQAFKYKLESENIWKKWSSDKISIDEKLECLSKIKESVRLSDNLLLIFDIAKFDILSHKEKLEEVFYEISRDAHPCAVVIYIIENDQLDNDSISDLLDSVNTRIIKDHSEEIFAEIVTESTEDIHDPVLVIGSNNQAFWYGGSSELINVLRESHKHTHILEKLQSFQTLKPDLKTKIKLYLENDTRLVNIVNGELIYNFISIDKHYEETIKQESKELDKKYCSPKLQVTNYWLNVKEILHKNEYGFALSLYLKYRAKFNLTGISENTYLVIDHDQQSKLAKAFADLLGINSRNIKNITTDLNLNIPRRTTLFKPDSNVIALTTVISSSETARRLVKYAKRDFASPIVVLSMGNFRKYRINSLETWNESTSIISCYQHYHKEKKAVEKDQNYFKDKHKTLNKNSFKIISPQLEFEDRSEIQALSVDGELLNLLTSHKLLHYNHIGVYNKRHFTFYVNKMKLLNLDHSIIYDNIRKKIHAWQKELQTPGKLYTYISESIYYQESGFIKALEDIPNVIVKRFQQNASHYTSESNVIYIDFGVLTGESVNNFIAKCNNVSNLLVLVIFNQRSSLVPNIYDRIASLNNTDPFYHKRSEEKTKFSINYLYDLPLNFHSSENCPICEHRSALERYKIHNKYLIDFSDDRRGKLNLRENSELHKLEYPVDFYYSERNKDHELSEIIIKEMYSLKILLENAKKFTHYRVELLNHIYDLNQNKQDLSINCESKLYALLYYLSHEIHWFQIEPLVFRDFRILISEISIFIATKSRTELSSYFNNSNRSKTSSDKLAVRYKYAGISVLRSTNKLSYCKSIYQIIYTSLSNGKFSDNLLQNTLYHISSLINNRYNRSIDYYQEIEENLKRVSDLAELTIPQRLAVQKLMLLNSSVLKSIQEPNPIKETEIFSKMQRDWKKLYDDTPKHPLPYQYLKVLNLKKHQSSFRSLEDGTADDTVRQLLLELTNSIADKWNRVRRILNTEIYHYLSSGLPLLMNSDFYKYYYSNPLGFKYFNRSSERFSELILLISSNPKLYNHNDSEYNRLYKYFEDNFIKQNGLSDYKDDSTFLDIVSQFPSCLPEQIDKAFTDVDFPKKVITIEPPLNASNCLVYFPKDQLRYYFELVTENIKTRLIEGFDTREIDISFYLQSTETETINLVISYNGTENTKDDPNHQKGGLNSWKNELMQFGGDLEYDKPSESDSNFVLTLNFIQYANI